MLNFSKMYLIQFLIGVILSLSTYSGFSIYQKNSLKKELKNVKNEVLELETQILLLKKNCKVQIANAVNIADANKTIEEIIKLQEIDQHEELAAHDHTNNSNDILNGMFIMRTED